jgi:hypothetical protein
MKKYLITLSSLTLVTLATFSARWNPSLLKRIDDGSIMNDIVRVQGTRLGNMGEINTIRANRNYRVLLRALACSKDNLACKKLPRR